MANASPSALLPHQPPPPPPPRLPLHFLPEAVGANGSTIFLAGWPSSIDDKVIVGLLGLLFCVALLAIRGCWRRKAGYAHVEGAPVHVCFELNHGLREDGELFLAGVDSVKALRLLLLQLADELLLDPEDDLGEFTLRYTDRKGALQPLTPANLGDVRKNAQELRVTAGRSLHSREASPKART